MREQDLPVPRDQRSFEDYPLGSVALYGPIEVDEAEIIEFGKRFDRQDFHTDPVKAAKSPFGGVIASGWLTGSMMMRTLVDRYLSRTAGMGSPGMDELRWTAPVRPGDRLWVKVTVIEARRSESKPDRGMVRIQIEVLNDKEVVVMSVKAMTLVRARTGAVA
jgi:acyl dehydratase